MTHPQCKTYVPLGHKETTSFSWLSISGKVINPKGNSYARNAYAVSVYTRNIISKYRIHNKSNLISKLNSLFINSSFYHCLVGRGTYKRSHMSLQLSRTESPNIKSSWLCSGAGYWAGEKKYPWKIKRDPPTHLTLRC